MLRRMAAVILALTLNPAVVGAQDTVLTVTVQTADLYTGPSNVTPVIGHVARGTVLPVSRNLGSWARVPWPDAVDGVAYVHVSMGRTAWGDTLRLSSMSGNIEVTLPHDARVDVAAETRTGTITSDFEIGQPRPSRLSRLKPTGSLGGRASGVIGAPERQLAISTIAGNILIRRHPE